MSVDINSGFLCSRFSAILSGSSFRLSLMLFDVEVKRDEKGWAWRSSTMEERNAADGAASAAGGPLNNSSYKASAENLLPAYSGSRRCGSGRAARILAGQSSKGVVYWTIGARFAAIVVGCRC